MRHPRKPSAPLRRILENAGLLSFATLLVMSVALGRYTGALVWWAFVAGTAIGWVMRDASRPGRATGERWVLHATAEWSQQHLEDSVDAVVPLLVAAFHAAAGIEARVAEAQGHRWRYALSRGLNAGSFDDMTHRIGVCGDWCADGRIEGAYLSGTELAAKLILAL